MPYLLDSDIAIDWLVGQGYAVALVDSLLEQGVSISVITYIEVYQGTLETRTSAETGKRLRARLSGMVLLPLSVPVAQECARIREDLRLAGKKPQRRAMDLIIAATAVEHGLTLVTRNVSDYEDIPGIGLYRETA